MLESLCAPPRQAILFSARLRLSANHLAELEAALLWALKLPDPLREDPKSRSLDGGSYKVPEVV